MLILTSCSQREEEVGSYSLTISLPVEESYFPQQAPARHLFGDPGTTEQFALPQHVYFFVLQYKSGTSKVLYATHERPQPSDWLLKRYSGSLQTTGDSIYEYTRIADMFIGQGVNSVGSVYAIASAKELHFFGTRTFEQIDWLRMSAEDIVNLQFNTAPDSIQQNLQNIYTTPYNYTHGGSYYGSFRTNAAQNVKSINLLLYHIAAKVDLTWSIAADKRINNANPADGIRLTYMEARRLYNGMAYCFKPLHNTAATLPSAGYAIPDIVTASDEGLWWEGRAYFYTIPYIVEGEKDYFPLQMVMKTNNNEGSGYQLTLKQPIDTSSVFVPWLRGNFNISTNLSNTTATLYATN